MDIYRQAFLGLTVIVMASAAVSALAQQPVSGYDYLTPEMQEMQDDEFGNPGILAVDAGAELFTAPGDNGKSCASCHDADGGKLNTDRIARYPIWSDMLNKPLTLRGQIVQCRNQRLGGPELKLADKQALRLEAFVRHLAKGKTVDVDISGPMASWYEGGKKLFHTRWGQVDIACHQCHDYYAGKRFRGQILTQGQSNGFPAYRFTTGEVVGTPERITGCLSNLRAEPYATDSDEYLALEVYMNARGNGLKIETPAIRY